jgi:hypothetical protein
MELNSNKEIQAFKNSENFRFVDIHKYLSNSILFFAAVLAQSFDVISTILCIKVGNGSEANLFIRGIINNAGVPGFVVIKFCLAFLVLLITYFVIEHKDNFGWKNIRMFYGIYIGTIISSIFVTISNLSVVYAGSSLYFLNLNSLQITVAILFMVPLAGLFLDIMNSPKTPQDYFSSFSLTYDNTQFLIFCFWFFLAGSLVNLSFGIYASNGGYIVNGILLGIVSAGIWHVRKIETLKKKVLTQ